jgi:formylglycine-generating enzyme required for sulfatase activity
MSTQYRAFISYSQQDKVLGRRFHTWLETYRVPAGVSIENKLPDRRLGRFFFDEEEMPAASDIAIKVRAAIENAEALIVLCSPRSAQSKWVNAEIQYFRRTGRNDKVFAVIIDGIPNSGDPATECFPPALRATGDPSDPDALPIEPLGLDIRKDGRQRLCARLAAGLLDVDVDNLLQRDRRRAEIRQRLVMIGVASASMVIALSSLGYAFRFEINREWVMRTQVRPHALSVEQLDKLRPGDTFRECSPAFACPSMTVVAGGDFVMGSPAREPGRLEREGPQQKVAVAKFAIGRFEITHEEWETCIRYTETAGFRAAEERDPLSKVGCDRLGDQGYGRGRKPVINASWDDAQGYVRWLNMLTSGNRSEPYRLLSEAEWEYAARAGASTAYPWGTDARRTCEFANVMTSKTNEAYSSFEGDAPAVCEDDHIETAPAGSFKPNAFGVSDMNGNVWEWVADCYRPTLLDQPADGAPYLSGDCTQRVLRGGSWYVGPGALRSAFRLTYVTSGRHIDFGFRIARTLAPPQ